MSISNFRIDKTGEVFGYDNTLNSILDANGVPVGKDKGLVAQDPSFDKSSSPTTIKVVLGHACNYSCSYCLQKDLGDPSERAKNIMTKELIRKMKHHLDLSGVKRIELWGGETLLYWKDIVEIISSLDAEGLSWYIPTNGTILKPKHAEFFSQMKGKMAIGISHDGPGHKTLRGPEFLHRKIEELTALQEAGVAYAFNSVISASNYDLFEIDGYFQEFLSKASLKAVGVGYELARTYEANACATHNYVISGEHIDAYRRILKSYLHQSLVYWKDSTTASGPKPSTNSLFHYGNCVLSYARSLHQQTPIRFHSNCGADDAGLITLDINGGLRLCQNTNEDYVYGSIASVDQARLQKVDFKKDDFCKDCSVLRLCNRSCPIELPKETFLVNHRIENAHYSELQLSAFELLFNSPITKLKD